MKSLFLVVILSLLALVTCLPRRFVNIKQKDQRVEKNIDEDGVHGSYTWRAPSGKIFFVKYVADEHGYRIVESNVLPSTASGVRTDGYQGTSRSAEDDDFDSFQTDEDDTSLSDEDELLDDSLDVTDEEDSLRELSDNSIETFEDEESLENDSVYESSEEYAIETARNNDDRSVKVVSVESVESVEDSKEDTDSKRVNDINSIEDNSIETVESIEDSDEDDTMEDDSDKKTILKTVDTDNIHSREENDVDDSSEENVKVSRVTVADDDDDQDDSSEETKAAASSQYRETSSDDNIAAEMFNAEYQSNTDEEDKDDEDDKSRTKYIIHKKVNDIDSIEDNSLETVESIEDSDKDNSFEDNSGKKTILRIVHKYSSQRQEKNDADNQDDTSEEKDATVSLDRTKGTISELEPEDDNVKYQDDEIDEEDNEEDEETQNEDEDENEDDESDSDKENNEENENEVVYSIYAEEASAEDDNE